VSGGAARRFESAKIHVGVRVSRYPGRQRVALDAGSDESGVVNGKGPRVRRWLRITRRAGVRWGRDKYTVGQIVVAEGSDGLKRRLHGAKNRPRRGRQVLIVSDDSLSSAMYMSQTDELDELMHAARNRVAHVVLIVVGIVSLISSQIVLEPFSLYRLMRIALWTLGCLVIFVLSALWYRARAAATTRLIAEVRARTCTITQVEVTRLRWKLIPVGVEVDVELASGEHLAFGFWRAETAERLVALLKTFGNVHDKKVKRASAVRPSS